MLDQRADNTLLTALCGERQHDDPCREAGPATEADQTDTQAGIMDYAR